jgi:hypothetical protein
MKRKAKREPSVLAGCEWAERGCSCESYYSYRCRRCRDSAAGNSPHESINDAFVAGLITWEGYGAPRLTAAGRAFLTEHRRTPAPKRRRK